MERFTGVSLSQSPDYRPSEGFVLIVLKEAETHARRFCSWKTHHFLETRQSLCLPNRILFLRERPCQRRAHHLLDPPHYGTIATSCCWSGQIVSAIGSQVSLIAFPWLMLAIN